jgi:protoporphyrinogen oxidase
MSNLRPFPVAISYVPFYIPADHADYQRSDQAFIDDAWACLKAIQPELNDHDLLASHCSRYRFAQPVCGVHCQQNLPPQNPFKGVITADTTAYYPEDRGISESIGFGRALARNVASLVRGHRE